MNDQSKKQSSPEQQGSSPSGADLASTRDRIIVAARYEFAKLGLTGARVDQIAKRAGVNKAMIYYHFDSKEKLYRHTLLSFFEQAANTIRDRLTTSSTLEEMLYAVTDTYARLFDDITLLRPILLRELASEDPELIGEMAGILIGAGLPTSIMTRLQEGIDNGELRPFDIRQATFSLITMNIGYALVYPIANKALNITDTKSFLEDRKRAIVDIFMHGVKAR